MLHLFICWLLNQFQSNVALGYLYMIRLNRCIYWNFYKKLLLGGYFNYPIYSLFSNVWNEYLTWCKYPISFIFTAEFTLEEIQQHVLPFSLFSKTCIILDMAHIPKHALILYCPLIPNQHIPNVDDISLNGCSGQLVLETNKGDLSYWSNKTKKTWKSILKFDVFIPRINITGTFGSLRYNDYSRYQIKI